MSTYWRLRCLDHDPILVAEGEFTQHTDDEYFKAAVRLVAQRPIDIEAILEDANERFDSVSLYYTGNTARFLRDHPKCKLDMISEYGVTREIETQNKEQFIKQIHDHVRATRAR